MTLQPGAYNLAWSVGLEAGAPAAADIDNFGLNVGGVQQLASDNPAVLGDYAQVGMQSLNLAVATVIAVKAIGAGTAAVQYAAQVSATPVGGYYATLSDGQAKPFFKGLVPSGGVLPFTLGTNGVRIRSALWSALSAPGPVTAAIYIRSRSEMN
jgi:hypothetical protein